MVTLDAQQTNPLLRGTTVLTGSAAANPDIPTVVGGALVSAASFGAPAAPGTLVSLFGNRLADGSATAPSLPLPVDLGGTTALLGGRPLPLVFSSQGQINAIVPYELAANVRHQLIVRRGMRQSVPEPIILAAVQPSVFTLDLSGKGQGHIYRITPEGGQVLAGPDNPVREGDFLVIDTTGLGAVDPPVAAGEAVPDAPLRRTTNPVRVFIDGQEAEVLFAGLYQVNLRLPGGLAAGTATVVIAVAGSSSPPVTVAVW